jgi:hypothetical protein
MRLILHSLLAMAAAAAVLVLVNLAGGEVARWLGLAPGGNARLGWDLAWTIAGGIAAIATAARCAAAAARGHALACLGLLGLATVYAVVQLGGDFPRWFNAGLVLSLPLQGWLGMRWGVRRADA